MEEQLFINGTEIELSPRSVSRTLQINDFGEVVDRQANYSNNIKIPKTDNNVIAFEFLGVVGTTTDIQYVEITSLRYSIGGIELITSGRVVFKNTDDYYNLIIYDGNISMASLLGTETLQDLDFSAYNHNLTYNAFLDSLQNTSGYVYTRNASGDEFTLSLTSPCFYIHTLISMIFSQKGWTISGSIFADADYLSRVTTMDVGFDNTNYTSSLSNVYTLAHSLTGVSGTATTGAIVPLLKDTYSVVTEGVYQVRFSGYISLTQGDDIYLQIRKNGSTVANIFPVTPSINNFYDVYADNGDTITVYIMVTPTEINPIKFDYTFDEIFTSYIDKDNSYFAVNFNDIIGNTKQIDFVKDFMQRFNLSFRKVRNTNEIEFITSASLLSGGGGTTEDWTNKFSKKVNETYTSSYGQQNIFKYIYDDSGDNFADGFMNVTNANLQDSKTILTSIFKASVKLLGEYQINLWNSDWESEQDGLRIFKVADSTNILYFRMEPDSNNYVSANLTAKTLDFSDLSYQEELDNNYVEFNNMLNEYRVVTIECNLSVIDIYQLDFFKLKTFDQLGRNFYLNRVINYQEGRTSKIELIQIPI